MTIGELAQAAGVGVETIRFYQRKGLIELPERPMGGHRRYDERAAQRIRFIRHAQELGFSLAEIRELLELRVDPQRSCADVRREAETKISEIDQKLAALHRMRSSLVDITHSCVGEGPTSECPILDALDAADVKR